MATSWCFSLQTSKFPTCFELVTFHCSYMIRDTEDRRERLLPLRDEDAASKHWRHIVFVQFPYSFRIVPEDL